MKKNIKYLFLFLLVTLYTSVFSQKKTQDSLLVVTKNSTNKKDKLTAYLDLLILSRPSLDSTAIANAKSYYKNAITLAEELGDKTFIFEAKFQLAITLALFYSAQEAKVILDDAHAIAKIINNDSVNAKIHYALALYKHIYVGFKEANADIYKSLEYNKKANVKGLNSYNYNLIGITYKSEGNNDLAYINYKKALNFALAEKDTYMVNLLYSNIGFILQEEKNYEKANEFFLKNLDFLEKFEIPVQAYVYFSIGDSYLKMREYSKALLYLEKALEISDYNSEVSLQQVNLTIGDVYLNQKDYVLARQKYKQAIEEKKSGINEEIFSAKGRLGVAHCDFFIKNKVASESFLNSLIKNFKEPTLISDFHALFGFYYKEIGYYKKAIKYLTLAIKNSNNNNDSFVKLELLKDLSVCYSKLGNFKQAFQYNLELTQIKDSIEVVSDKKEINVRKLIQNYEEEIVHKQLLINEKENSLLKKQTQKSYFIGVLVVIILMLIGIFMRYDSLKNTKNEKANEAVKLQEAYSIIENDENEKKILAEFIHEKISQDLISVVFNLQSIEKTNAEIKSILKQLESPISKLREISYELSPPALNYIGIEDIIQDYIYQISEKFNKTLSVKFKGGKIELSSEQQIAVYRIIQELVKNVVNSPKATEGSITFKNSQNLLKIDMKHNGENLDNDWQNSIGWKRAKYRLIILNASYKVEPLKNSAIISIIINTASNT